MTVLEIKLRSDSWSKALPWKWQGLPSLKDNKRNLEFQKSSWGWIFLPRIADVCPHCWLSVWKIQLDFPWLGAVSWEFKDGQQEHMVKWMQQTWKTFFGSFSGWGGGAGRKGGGSLLKCPHVSRSPEILLNHAQVVGCLYLCLGPGWEQFPL